MNSTVSLFFLFLVFIGVLGCRVQSSPPELVRLSASQAFINDPLTLTGYQFGPTPTVTFGVATSAVNAPIKSNDENSIQIIVPRVPPGKTQVRVRTDQGTSDPLPFIVEQPAPLLTAVTPSNGLPGTTVVVTGDYLNQITRVRFNDINAIITDSTAQKLTIVVPPNLPRGPLALAIETTGGNLSIPFIIAGTPTITSISPLQTKPGADLVIQGTNLLDGVVSINGLPTDKSLTTIKDTEIHTTVPATATSGLVTVKVFETLVATSTDTLKIIQPPFITNLLALDGIAGDKLIIAGRNLSTVTSVLFGNVATTFRILSDTQIEATVPTLPTSGAVTISAGSVGGNATATDPFFFYLPPSSLVVTPARQLRGLTLTVSGKNLYRITSVSISGITVPITSRNEGTDFLIGVPTNAVSGSVTVSSRAGTASAPVVIVQPPIVTDVLPVKARPNERIVIRGDFLLNAQIFFTGSTTAASDGGKNEDTERWVLVPVAAQAGPLRIVNIAGETSTTTSFSVIRLATITDFTPKTAKIGDEITITGQNLSTVTSVQFSGGTSTPASFRISGSSLIATVPAGTATGQICLTNDAGTVCTTSNFTVSK